ncbi:MAG: hypothetical protein FWG45_03665 [Oscillospiraceae bacterium]|nr:hypothetical protein [Oscillospiraceae bacterium]
MGWFSIKPKWQSKNEKRALKALLKLNRQADIAQVAKYAPLGSVSCAAVELLTNQELLTSVAVGGKNIHGRRAAIAKMDDSFAGHSDV